MQGIWTMLSKKAFASVVRYTLVASTGMVIVSATSVAADDTAAFQRLEAKIQQLDGVEVAASYKNLFAQGEYYQSIVAPR